jgi:hypothetical protein
MKLSRATNRQLTCCLILSGVLILGIIQWSFLPVLMQNAPISSRAILEISPGHSSKFAAPFKGLLIDFLGPHLTPSRVTTPLNAAGVLYRSEEPSIKQDNQFFSHRQLRSPPSA